MTSWMRISLFVSSVLIGAALLVFVPSAASVAASDQVCTVVGELRGEDPAEGSRAVRELFADRDDDPQDIAARIVDCLTEDDESTSEQQVDGFCAVAAKLVKAEEHAQAIVLIRALRVQLGDDTSCRKELTDAEKGRTTPQDLGELWAAFAESVLKPLTPPAVFVGLLALVLIALGRLAALLPFLRDPKRFVFLQRRPARGLAWAVGVALVIVLPVLVALRGMWIMRAAGPGERAPAVDEFPVFVGVVRDMGAGFWLGAAVFAALTVLVWSFVFASGRRVTINVSGKTDGTTLDKSQLMAAIDGMAGGRRRGLEFPVGTDLTAAADGVTKISNSKFVAAVQSALKAIFGTAPWELAVENEATDAASIAISRNGVLLRAKRIRVPEEHPLAEITEIAAAERLGALVAGELVAAMRTRYQPDFDRGLHGATDGESIGLQFLASSALSGSLSARTKGVPLLARAIAVDPSNRAAWVTFVNFVYRNPDLHRTDDPRPHAEYRREVMAAIENELRRERSAWAPWRWSLRLRRGEDDPSRMPQEAREATPKSLRANALLTRLVHAYTVATANLGALEPRAVDRTEDKQLRALDRLVAGQSSRRDEAHVTATRRRQSLLIDEFRRTTWKPGMELSTPDVLSRRALRTEKRAWEQAAERATARGLADRFACEAAALSASGDFAHDPIIAYAVACYRVVHWWPHTSSPMGAVMTEPTLDWQELKKRAVKVKEVAGEATAAATTLTSGPAAATVDLRVTRSARLARISARATTAAADALIRVCVEAETNSTERSQQLQTRAGLEETTRVARVEQSAKHAEFDAAKAEWEEAKRRSGQRRRAKERVAQAKSELNEADAALEEAEKALGESSEQIEATRIALTALVDRALSRTRAVMQAEAQTRQEIAAIASTSPKAPDQKAFEGAVEVLGSRTRELSEFDTVAVSVHTLLTVAALHEGAREWFPIDPELSLIRGTAVVPSAITRKADVADPAKETDKKSAKKPAKGR